MGYFKELPNLQYQSFLTKNESSIDYIKVKNIFRRVKLRDDLQNVFTMFEKYEIPDEFRPENVAEDFYGSDELDWVVIVTANGPKSTSGIINLRNDWPLSTRDIYDYSFNKYGSTLNSTRYYETKEIKDSSQRVVLPKGKVIDPDFSFKYYDPNDPLNNNGYVTKSGNDVRNGVSNFNYEIELNDNKRSIYLLKPIYLQDFLNDFRSIMVYGKSSQYLDDNTIKTENTNITMP